MACAAASGSSAPITAAHTHTQLAPAAMIAAALSDVIPPMATHGICVHLAASVSICGPAMWSCGLVWLGNIGPTAR